MNARRRLTEPPNPDAVVQIFTFATSTMLADEMLVGVHANEPVVRKAAEMAAHTVVQTFRVPGQEAYSHSWPLDWWEAVKERFAPEWFTNRWPVRYEHVSIKALLPKLHLPMNEAISWNVSITR